jgi:AraC-like DNA-binding protein
MDKLSNLLRRCSFNARVFFNGDFCDANHFSDDGLTGHLHLVRTGPVVFSHAGSAPLLVDEPGMVFYPRGASHDLEVPAGANATLLCAAISFEGGHASPLAQVLPDCMHVPLADMGHMHHTLELLFAEASRAGHGRDVILDRLCDVLMVQVIRHEFDKGALDTGVLAGLTDRQLAPVLEAIHARPHEPWQLPSLAKLACMSRTGFSGHFRNVVGMSPGEYLARWRIGLACRLLREGWQVKAASARAGYTSPAAFTRSFTGHIGVSPREWLRQLEHAG